ncbi:MAG: SDR family oxidoreductase [Magnetococcales bacterium]|nr:SDR family oxidoreductase [Magnetococcales bacterium]
MRKHLIIGATSAIAQATMRHFAQDGDDFFMVARNAERLSALETDLKHRGAGRVASLVMDANQVEKHAQLFDQAADTMGGLDHILVAHGVLSEQTACQQSYEETLASLETNALSVLSLLTLAANRFEAQQTGTIAVISSVAGDRGRQSNYVYGSAKALVSTFMDGLRNRLHKSGVAVVNIKPGFVDTPMTVHYEKSMIWAQPESVAKDIYQAIRHKKSVCYTPWFWRWIMLIIRHIPEPIFKRLSL